ncbi:hypothetical protein IVA80_25720 [Bradyrhizobium sp. 139]|uniref:hypothetical protein n=1 Tax=Bradyrhizobium sp. 139 TaxID=2782616 RepID=UPI001FF9D0D5|nr:hypothetical protein [Bradyrhizobium sp. 139]MCK1744141.1 hypothetical protein [Bradyrhizobium sp. 139]
MPDRIPSFAAMVLLLAASIPAHGQTSGPTGPAQVLTPSQVIQNKDKLLNNNVVVEGVLENEGTNYFTNSRMVIKQPGSDKSVVVRLRAPLEIQRPLSGQQSTPPTQADYLGKKVKIQGVLREQFVRGLGRAIVLESAQPPSID